MCMRGVEKSGNSIQILIGSITITSSVIGCFRKDLRTRTEFFSALNLTKS